MMDEWIYSDEQGWFLYVTSKIGQRATTRIELGQRALDYLESENGESLKEAWYG